MADPRETKAGAGGHDWASSEGGDGLQLLDSIVVNPGGVDTSRIADAVRFDSGDGAVRRQQISDRRELPPSVGYNGWGRRR